MIKSIAFEMTVVKYLKRYFQKLRFFKIMVLLKKNLKIYFNLHIFYLDFTEFRMVI